MGRPAVPVLLLLLVAGLAAAQVVDPDTLPKPERDVTCWDCHQTTVGDSGPLRTFVDLVFPEQAGAPPGEAFEYRIQARNAWSHEMRSLRLTLDLTTAPSLGFAADVPPVDELIADTIPVDPVTATMQPQRREVTVFVPAGETRMTVVLQPGGGATGSDLRLRVHPPSNPVGHEPYDVRDDGAAGEAETFTADRAVFNEAGYGNWTFVVEAQVLPDPQGGGGGALPTGASGIPFELKVDAVAEATDDRVASLLTREPVAKGGSTSLAFRLFAIGPPTPGEVVTVRADLWAHYKHQQDPPDDDENATKTHPQPILVVDDAGSTVLRTDAGAIIAPAPIQNGASLATVSEAVGYATAFLLVASVVTGGLFGKASRRALNGVFGSAKRRVAFHNFLSYGILLAATVHTVLFVVEVAYHWTLGLLWGGAAVVALLGLGVTGAVQVPLVRSWGYGAWRWTHYGLAVAAIAFTVVHVLLDGVHFADVQNAVGWKDPLDPRDLA